MMAKAKIIELNKQKNYRIIPSTFPPINFFEDLVDPAEMEILFEIESMTNDRIRQEIGDIFLVPAEDRISGAGSSVVMAAFTHVHKPSRFTDGTYGVYYAGLSLETAVRETVYHREIFLKATREAPGEIAMRVYESQIKKPLHDIRQNDSFSDLYHPDDYFASQEFGKRLKAENSWGIIYDSVRHASGNCIAIFRPPAIAIPRVISHLRYCWDGERIATVLNTQAIMELT